MASKSSSSRSGRPAERLSSYRPVLDRIVFGIALLGMLTAAHLFIQQERGFDRGCLGFSAPTAAPADCSVVTQSEASQLFGVSNAVWGFLFYALIAGMSLALPTAGRRVASLKKARALLIGVGFAYSMYLVYYQAAELNEFCVLCLISASLVTLLFILQLVDAFRPPDPAARAAVPARREPALMAGLIAAVFLLVGADFAYFSSLEPAAGAPHELVLNTSQGNAVPEGSGPSAECRYDPEYEPYTDYASLVTPVDPYVGNPNASVTVVEFFDPNCPHCATLYPTMKAVAEKYGDQARFVYKPFVIWQQSVAQSAALLAAAQEGKFFDMLELQFANQNPQGLAPQQLAQIAEHIGMDPNVLTQRLESGIYNPVLQQIRSQGERLGIRSVPTVVINGRIVATPSKTAECLGQFIEQAARS